MAITMTWKRWAILVAIVLAITVGLHICWPSKSNINTNQTQVDLLTAQATKDQQAIADKDKKITDLKNRLAVSEAKYKILVVKYAELQKEKENVQPAKDMQELIARFISVGYTPAPCTMCGAGVICFDTGYSQ
jgi:uncharacterized protein HemX